MSKRKHAQHSHCPIAYTLDIIGDRWSILIVRDIIFAGKTSFGEFSKSDEGIASNILTDRLKRLERQGILSKKQDANNLSKYVYALSDKGLDLLPLMVEMIVFSGNYDPNTVVSKQVLNKIKRDRNEFMEEFRKEHKGGN